MEELVLALMLLMLMGALIAVETEHLLSSVVSLGAVGLLLSIVYLLLGAPDIAITQIVVEILCLVILIRATLHRDLAEESLPLDVVSRVGAVTVVVVALVWGVQTLRVFPDWGAAAMDRFADAPSAYYLQAALPETGAANVVTAVLLDFRAYDTLGEATVLFCAIVGTLAVLRRRARQPPENREDAP